MNDAIIQNGNTDRCVAVHYNAGVQTAQDHFRDAGFHGVTRFEVIDRDLDCNEARRRVNDMAARGEGVAFYQGVWDYSADRCSIYRFRFTSYEGPRTTDKAFADHADYVGD